MDVPTQLELCLYDQLDIASWLLVSLPFIAIPTPILNFYFYLFLVKITIPCCFEGFHIQSHI